MAAEAQELRQAMQLLAGAVERNQQQVDQQLGALQAAMLQQMQQQIPAPAPAAAQQPVILRSQGSLPEKFGGETGQMRAFLAQCTMFFESRPAEFPTDRTRVTFILGLLRGRAARWSIPMVENNDPILNNYGNFLDQFRAHFDDPIRTITASREIRRLKQGGRRVGDYIADFKMWAGDLNWNQEALIDQFRQGLHEDIKTEIIRQGPPATLEELYQRCVVIDARREEMRQTQPEKRRGFRAPFPGFTYTSGTDACSAAEEPMQIGAARRFLPEEERQRRRVRALCFFCGAPGHMIRACPVKGQAMQTKIAGQVVQHRANPSLPSNQGNFSGLPSQSPAGRPSSN